MAGNKPVSPYSGGGQKSKAPPVVGTGGSYDPNYVAVPDLPYLGGDLGAGVIANRQANVAGGPGTWFGANQQVKAMPPRYLSGDDLNIVMGWSDSGELAGIQQALIAAGLLPDDTVLGSPDNATITVIRNAMSVANRTGEEFQASLMGMVQSGAAANGGSGGAAKLLPNPDDVKALLNDSAYKLVGRNLDPGSLDAGVQAFYNAYQPQGGYQSPDPSTIAEGYLRNTQPQEVSAHAATKVYDVFSSMLDGLR